jgi:hypothetical protein
MLRKKLRTLAQYLSEHGTAVILVNEKYFVAGAVQSVRSLEDALRLLPIDNTEATGLHFISGLDWLNLGWEHYKVGYIYAGIGQEEGYIKAHENHLGTSPRTHGWRKRVVEERGELDKRAEKLKLAIEFKLKQQANEPSRNCD